MENIKIGNLISFHESSNADSKTLKGVVGFKDQLGLITVIDGIQYELKKLLDIKILN